MNWREQLAAYALGELEGPELAAFERRLQAEPELRAELEATGSMVGQLEEMPAAGWPSGTAGSPAPGHQPEPQVAHRRRPLRAAIAVGAFLAAFVAGGAVGAVLWDGGSGGGSAPTAITLHPLQAPARSRADISMPSPGTMLLRVSGLPRSENDQYYEVWLMSTPAALVPVASFRVGPAGTATVEVPLPADPTDFRYFDVSRQTVQGGTEHSGESVLRGSTAS